MSNSVDPEETVHYIIMSRLIWIHAVYKRLLLSPVAVKELIHSSNYTWLSLAEELFFQGRTND